MRRFDRLEALGRALRDRPGATAASLAAELGVSLRSVFRDLEALRARGYPIEASRGRGGGVRLHASWGVGRVLFSSEEALCALLGLAVSERLGLPMFEAELGRARGKLVDAFPSGERRRLAPLRERVLIGANASPAVRASYGTPRAAAMRGVQDAFVSQRAARVVYEAGAGSRLERTIEPHALVINWPAWYVLALDHLRDAPRTFRLDRFADATVLPVAFLPRPRAMARDLLGEESVPLRSL